MNEIVTKATFDNFESQSIPLCLNSTLKMREDKKKISKIYKNDSTERGYGKSMAFIFVK